MGPVEKLHNVFGTLDCVTFTKRYEYFTPKDKTVDLPDDFFADVKTYLNSGEHPDRNPLPWVLFCEKNVEVGDEIWERGISNYYRLFFEPEISELDNEKDYVILEIEFDVLALNARSLPQTAFEGVECVIVKTALGEFQIVPEVSEDTD